MRDAGAVLLLAVLAIWLFRGHFFGDSLWIGNPDRLNGELKYLRHYLSGLENGALSAWNEHEMMGYDSLAMAGTSTNPLVYLVSLFGQANLYVSMGYVVIGLLAASGLAAYAFIRALIPAGAAALVGAICYEFSALSLLKDSQNSMTFAVLILIPLFLLALHHVRRGTEAWCFLSLTLLLISMLSYMFLQKAAYALMLVGAYAIWRSWAHRSCRPVIVFVLAFLVALAFSLPRILAVGLALGEFRRAIEGVNLRDFEVLYRFQNIYPYEILRWFDYSIFGRSPSDAAFLKNNINLTEGFLLSTSSAVPFLLLAGMIHSRFSWAYPIRPSPREEAFFFWILIACISVIVLKPVAHLVFLLFLGLDFTHARIQISALMSIALLVAIALSDIAPPGRASLRQRLLGVILGLLTALAIDAIAKMFPQAIQYSDLLPPPPPQAPFLRAEALVRILLSLAAFVLMRRFVTAGGKKFQHAAYLAMCTFIVGQCLLAANQQINGPHTLDFAHPFNRGDSYQARREEFEVPDERQLKDLHERVNPMEYRVAFICDPQIADGFCAGHTPEFWRLRAIDGYYGPGVPRRLRALPWPNSVSLRTISFTSLESIPWDLLGLLNVRWVMEASDGMFRNIAREGDQITSRADPGKFAIRPSPAHVVPRAFFAATIMPVASPEDAAKQLFPGGRVLDPSDTSFVEGIGTIRTFPLGGAVTVDGANDSLELRFEAAAEERFLVLNELYYPGWQAHSEGHDLPILATNAVMRGVVVPSGARSVKFQYVSYLDSAASWSFRIAATFLLLGLFFYMHRKARQ